MSGSGSWDEMTWRRKLETFNGKDDSTAFATGPAGETDGIWYAFDNGREEALSNMPTVYLVSLPTRAEKQRSIWDADYAACMLTNSILCLRILVVQNRYTYGRHPSLALWNQYNRHSTPSIPPGIDHPDLLHLL